MAAGYRDITIEQGATWSMTARKTSGLLDVSSITLTGSTVTASVLDHDFTTGDLVFVTGADQNDYNGVHEITVSSNDVFTYDITFDVSPDSPATGTVKVGKITDLSGYGARMKIKQFKGSTDTEIELTTSNGRISIDGVNGLITLNIAASDTSSLDFDKGVYDLELYTGSVVERLLEGRVTLSKEVTD